VWRNGERMHLTSVHCGVGRLQDVALGFVRVANEAMCRPIRELTQAKGYDTTTHILSCFGGAGGQHACAIARSLGMTEINVHKYSGILSAYGLAMADVVSEQTAPCAAQFDPASFPQLLAQFEKLTAQGEAELRKNGFDRATMTAELFLNMRYRGTDCCFMTPPTEGASVQLDGVGATAMAEFLSTFRKIYIREFGFEIAGADVLIDDVRVRLTAHTEPPKEAVQTRVTGAAPVHDVVKVCFDGHGWVDCPEYQWERLQFGQTVSGPAIVISSNSTVVVEPGCTGVVTERGNIRVIVGDGVAAAISTALNSIHLAIFGHRFMSIAEQMGRSLQRTSVSVNIKERLDFSCALFSPHGGLVANAPHIPVHLGAMQEAVKFQIEHLKDDIHPGDVLLSNHPAAGGSHLPDITVMTPVFVPGHTAPIFFVASRGHHADIGGITPGSMPPTSTSLEQEGAAIVSFKIVRGGVFQEAGITAVLEDPGPDPESSGTRKLSDNLSDLRAQVAANQRGIQLVNELINECGLEVVLAYMDHIQANAEVAVREMLKARAVECDATFVAADGRVQLVAEDYMDDGSPISLTVSIDPQTGDATFDFSGTGYEVLGNCNAPKAVTYSAVIYCLRCMVGYDIPLNQGCLAPITIVIPEGSLLNPSRTAAVVGGNVLTSQRVTDVVLKAFGACAASQGCMNNTTYGDDTFGCVRFVTRAIASQHTDWGYPAHVQCN
jgi:5-oxoprolinase (ATP-hydrolysing)